MKREDNKGKWSIGRGRGQRKWNWVYFSVSFSSFSSFPSPLSVLPHMCHDEPRFIAITDEVSKNILLPVPTTYVVTDVVKYITTAGQYIRNSRPGSGSNANVHSSSQAYPHLLQDKHILRDWRLSSKNGDVWYGTDRVERLMHQKAFAKPFNSS